MSPIFRSADHLGPEHVGRRVTVRKRNDDSTQSDVVGILEQVTDDAVLVRDRRGETRTIERARIVACRVIA